MICWKPLLSNALWFKLRNFALSFVLIWTKFTFLRLSPLQSTNLWLHLQGLQVDFALTILVSIRHMTRVDNIFSTTASLVSASWHVLRWHIWSSQKSPQEGSTKFNINIHKRTLLFPNMLWYDAYVLTLKLILCSIWSLQMLIPTVVVLVCFSAAYCKGKNYCFNKNQ